MTEEIKIVFNRKGEARLYVDGEYVERAIDLTDLDAVEDFAGVCIEAYFGKIKSVHSIVDVDEEDSVDTIVMVDKLEIIDKFTGEYIDAYSVLVWDGVRGVIKVKRIKF